MRPLEKKAYILTLLKLLLLVTTDWYWFHINFLKLLLLVPIEHGITASVHWFHIHFLPPIGFGVPPVSVHFVFRKDNSFCFVFPFILLFVLLKRPLWKVSYPWQIFFHIHVGFSEPSGDDLYRFKMCQDLSC